MIEAIISVGVGLIVVPWCVFVTKAIFRQDKALAVMKGELKYDREKLTDLIRFLKDKLTVRTIS